MEGRKERRGRKKPFHFKSEGKGEIERGLFSFLSLSSVCSWEEKMGVEGRGREKKGGSCGLWNSLKRFRADRGGKGKKILSGSFYLVLPKRKGREEEEANILSTDSCTLFSPSASPFLTQFCSRLLPSLAGCHGQYFADFVLLLPCREGGSSY